MLNKTARSFFVVSFFFFNDTATTEIYTLSLHDALPLQWKGAVSITPPRSDWVRRTPTDRKSTRLNSSHAHISYAVFCLKKKKNKPLQYYLKNKKHKQTQKTTNIYKE